MRTRIDVKGLVAGIDVIAFYQRRLPNMAAPRKRDGWLSGGVCPFHSESSPSFRVHAQTGRYRCFGCGVNGDLLDFIMHRDGLDFRGAVAVLQAEARGAA